MPTQRRHRAGGGESRGAAGEELGFDVFTIRQEPERGLMLTAGRYIASRLFVSLQQPLRIGSDRPAEQDGGQRPRLRAGVPLAAVAPHHAPGRQPARQPADAGAACVLSGWSRPCSCCAWAVPLAAQDALSGVGPPPRSASSSASGGARPSRRRSSGPASRSPSGAAWSVSAGPSAGCPWSPTWATIPSARRAPAGRRAAQEHLHACRLPRR